MKSPITLNKVIPFVNEEYEGIQVLWNGEMGFGQYIIYKPVKSKDANNTWFVDTEHMSKSWLPDLLQQWVNQMEVTG